MFFFGLFIALVALVYLGPIVIMIWAARRIYLSRKTGDPLPPRTLSGLVGLAVVSGVFSLWIWGYTIDEMSHSEDLPSVASMTVTQAQLELGSAGFHNTVVDYGSVSAQEQSTACVVSGTTPEPYDPVDTRDQVVLHVSYCPPR